MTNPSNIERVVMRRVHTVWLLRFVFCGFTANVVLLVAALFGIGRLVWVARVLENMPHSGDALAVVRFYAAALGHTDLVVQALTLAMFVSIVYIARESARGISTVFIQRVSL